MSNDDTLRDALRGVTVGLTTPFDDGGDVRFDALADNAVALSDRGARTFLAPANISEYHSLSRDERVEFAATVVDALPDDATVLAGAGGSTAAATDLRRAYEDVGADATMVMPPDHTYVHEKGLLAYYRELDAAGDAPLVPYVRGFEPSVDFLANLTRIDGVVGIKYAVPDAVTLGAAVERGADDVVWVDGLAEPHAPSFWAEGAEGFTAGVSNFRPAVGLALYDALADGDWERARALRNACLPFQRLRDESGDDNAIPGALSVPVVKAGLDCAGLTGGDVREPLRPLTDGERDRVDDVYDRLENDLDRLLD